MLYQNQPLLIDLTASDDVETSLNFEWNFQMLALTAFPATINSLPPPFLACHSAVFGHTYNLNFIKPKRRQMLWETIIYCEWHGIQESLRRGQWQSPFGVASL